MSFVKVVTPLLLILAGVAACDEKPAPAPPDRDKLYGLFERAADFSVALDRLDIVCGAPAPGDRAERLSREAATVLDAEQEARLSAFVEDHREAVFDTYRGEYCGFAVAAERDNYLEAYKVHRERLESALAKFNASIGSK